jgi:hypothetical protein
MSSKMICRTHQSRRDSDAEDRIRFLTVSWYSSMRRCGESRPADSFHNACEICVPRYFFSHGSWIMTGSAIMAWSRGNGMGVCKGRSAENCGCSCEKLYSSINATHPLSIFSMLLCLIIVYQWFLFQAVVLQYRGCIGELLESLHSWQWVVR